MLTAEGKTILQRQLETLRQCGSNDITIVRAYQKEMIDYLGIKCYYNDNYASNNILGSLFYDEDEVELK